MITIRKENGKIIQVPNSVVANYKPQDFMEEIINYDLVDRSKTHLSSTTVTYLMKELEIDDINQLFNRIIVCTNRQELEDITEDFLKMSTLNKYNVLSDYATKTGTYYSFKNDSPAQKYDKSKKKLDISIDTTMHKVVTKVIDYYFTNVVIALEKNNQEVYEKVVNYYKYDPDKIAELFESEFNKIKREDLKAYAVYSLFKALKLKIKQDERTHLCANCVCAYPDICPKVKAAPPKHLADFDFITDGEEVDYEPGDKRATTIKTKSVKTEEGDVLPEVEEKVDLRDNVKEILITGCRLKEEYDAKKYVRKSVYIKTSKY